MTTPAPPYRIGPFTFDPHTGELAQNGDVTRLRPQAAAALALLAVHAGDLVSRAALRKAVWPEGHADADLGLNVCIAQIRSALGDDAEVPSYVETLRGRGYRLVAEVQSIAREPANARRGGGRIALAGVLAIAFIAAGVALERSRSSEPSAVRLAVLPFELLPHADSLAYLTEGIAQDLITTLADIDPARLAVIGRTSSFGLAASGAEANEVARLVRAGYVLEGAIQHSSSGLRITAQLLDVGTGAYAWSAALDLPGTQPGPADRLVDARLLSAMGVTGVAAPGAPAMADVPAEVAETLLRARYLRERFTRDASQRAKTLLESALDSHRGSVALLIELAAHHLVLGELDPAEQRLAEARAIDEDAAGLAHVAGRVALYGRRDPASAIGYFDRAVRRQPGTAEIRHDRAQALLAVGRADEAALEGDVALDLDPVSSTVRGDIGWVYYYAGRTADARRVCHSLLELRPESMSARRCVLFAAAISGDLVEEADFIAALIADIGAPPADVERLRDAVLEGNEDQLWDWLLDEVPAQTLDPVDRARLLTLAGRRDEAAAGWAQIMSSPAPPFFAEYDPLYRVGDEGP